MRQCEIKDLGNLAFDDFKEKYKTSKCRPIAQISALYRRKLHFLLKKICVQINNSYNFIRPLST